MTQRKTNFEWLRILAMAMIVTLHYMFKGEIVHSLNGNVTAANLIYWLIVSFAICAVNVYVLISGYFLVEAEFKPLKLGALLIQVIEYAVVFGLIMIAVGGVDVHTLSIYDFLKLIFPIGNDTYWFITAYVVMYAFSPILAAGVKSVDKKTLQVAIAILLAFFCIEKTLLPMNLPTDSNGYSFGWFIMLFLIAAYIRLYGIGFLEGKKGSSAILFCSASTLIWLECIFANLIYSVTGKETFLMYADIAYDYNNVLVLASAIGLFYLFKNTEFNETGKLSNIARTLGPLTLGVYLVHEHIWIRYRWFNWLGLQKIKEVASPVLTLIHWILCVIIVMTVGLCIEWGRKKLHSIIHK